MKLEEYLIRKNTEYTFLAGVFGGQEYKTNSDNKAQSISWYETKNSLNKLFKNVDLSIEWSQFTKNLGQQFHPGRSVF